VNLLPNMAARTVRLVKQQIDTLKQAGDIVVASIHWGSNWGYAVPQDHIDFAHRLIDEAGVDVIYGQCSYRVLHHSSSGPPSSSVRVLGPARFFSSSSL